MATDHLPNIPDAAEVFLDANIFIYAFTGKSRECADLLDRCVRQNVLGITAHETINEVTHRLMVHEAFHKGLIAKARADALREKPAIIRSLTDYWAQTSQIFNMNLLIVETADTILHRAHGIRLAHGLMTLDSVIVATMEEYGLDRIASLDTDFKPVGKLTVYHPTDIP